MYNSDICQRIISRFARTQFQICKPHLDCHKILHFSIMIFDNILEQTCEAYNCNISENRFANLCTTEYIDPISELT